MQSIEAKRALEVNKMSELVSQVEAIKVEVEHLAKDVEGNFYINMYIQLQVVSTYVATLKSNKKHSTNNKCLDIDCNIQH